MIKNSKALLIIGVLAFGMIVGCTGKKRIEGVEVPTQPQPEEQVVAPPPPIAAAPTATAEPTPQAPPPPIEEAAVPTPEPTAVPTEAPPPPTVDPCSKYIVVKGDTLWDISGSGNGYHDNFQWPLIFKANRDQIVDPDLIYPKQEFCIRHDFNDAEVQKAIKDASDTPVYVPHHKPREVLPINYF